MFAQFGSHGGSIGSGEQPGVGSAGDDHARSRGTMPVDECENLEPVDMRHHQVEHDGIEAFRLQRGNRGAAVDSLGDRIPGARDDARNEEANGGVIIDDQNPDAHDQVGRTNSASRPSEHGRAFHPSLRVGQLCNDRLR